jgi:non-ribosomal peptide synthetase component F
VKESGRPALLDESTQLGWRPREFASGGRTLSSLFAAQVARTPDRVAVSFNGAILTYAELHARADELAARLVAAGAGPERPVGVCLERSLDLIVALVGVLRSGAVCLPLDPAYPPDRLRFMATDARPVCVVADLDLARDFGFEAPLIGVNAASPELYPAAPSRSDNAAYILYTSGSTGVPKGVIITHGNLARLFPATTDWIDHGPGQVGALFCAYGFDVSTWEMWGVAARRTAGLDRVRSPIVAGSVSRCPRARGRLGRLSDAVPRR